MDTPTSLRTYDYGTPQYFFLQDHARISNIPVSHR